ncbi:sugar MFS transporter [Archangium sp.]|uniref:sugar MFS transporter n=1 Tax=Archangium sp. TaxID=1872627 RepID=UPI002D6481DB|nr:sugar MFS transporter [Archangium sp.]HYO56172.1 sugar MFS transporter [Archangium sp.]
MLTSSEEALEPTSSTPAVQARSYGPAMAVLISLFFTWGLVTNLNDVLTPHLKNVFELGYAGSALVQFAFFFAYCVMSLPAGRLLAAIGYKRGIAVGLVMAGVGALLFYPAASIPSYPFFLIAIFVLASGITILQVAANPYVTALGPPETASSRLNLTQGFNSLGTTVAPYLGGVLILSDTSLLGGGIAAARAVRLPYLGVAAALFALAALTMLSRLPPIRSADGEGAGTGRLRDAIKVPHLMFAVAGIFLYVGAEVAIGTFLVNFMTQPSISSLSLAQAAAHVSYYWGGSLIGRFLGSAVLQKLDAGKLLGGCGLAAAALVACGVVFSGSVAMWSLLAVGLFNSIMFPTIFALGIDGLGKLRDQGASLLIMAIVGGAVIPVLFGLLADVIGVHRAFILPALCYVYIACFGFWGSRSRDAVAPGADCTPA